MFDKLEPKEWMKLNAQLQQKKNAVRAELATIGVLEKKGSNDYDHYKYFSEAQYKELFTDLFPKHKLDLSFSEVAYDTYEASGKNCNGRLTKLRFCLHDTETGFYEATIITGEGADKGDKGGYKAYTGALKYYLANTFMVATGDDPETESPEGKSGRRNDPKITADQAKQLEEFAASVGVTVEQICKTFRVNSLQDMTQSMRAQATQMLMNDQKKGQK